MNSAHGRKGEPKLQVEGHGAEPRLRTLYRASPLCVALYPSSLYSLNTHNSPAQGQYCSISFTFTLQRGKLRPREAQKVTLGHAVRRRQEGSDIKVSVL